jgi:LysR family hca operon transcriptional activator
MEPRHLGYVTAVVEEGRLTAAAERRLRILKPSLSRQIRDLEYEVGAPLLTPRRTGVDLTPAGRAFSWTIRGSPVARANTAVEATRQAGRPEKPTFHVGLLIGD